VGKIVANHVFPISNVGNFHLGRDVRLYTLYIINCEKLGDVATLTRQRKGDVFPEWGGGAVVKETHVLQEIGIQRNQENRSDCQLSSQRGNIAINCYY
jgi:hypothetical protein